MISIANVENAQESTRLLAQTSLRNVLGTISLAEILSNRESVSSCMREILDEATDRWLALNIYIENFCYSVYYSFDLKGYKSRKS